MLFSKKNNFLFECDTCKMILSVDLEEEKDIQEYKDDKVLLECPCGGLCLPLRD